MPVKWEHCILEGKTVTVLGKGILKKEWKLTERGAWNELGNEGWELVAVVPSTNTKDEDTTRYYFKRQIVE